MNPRLKDEAAMAEVAVPTEGARGREHFERLSLIDGGRRDRQSEKRVKKLLVVDDDDVDRERIIRLIRKHDLPVVVTMAVSGREALDKLSEEHVDIVFLDYQLGDMTGADLLERMKDDNINDVLTVMVTGMGDEKTAIEAMRLGVYDYLPKKEMTADTMMSVLVSAMRASAMGRQLREAQERMRRMSLYDSLTGLPNRNLFFDRLNQFIQTSGRHQEGFSILMIDLTLFKEVNDEHGHAVGDHVLSIIASRLENAVRKTDTVSRLGGDEFICLLEETAGDEAAVHCAKKLLEEIAKPVAVNGRILQVGASIGIAHFPEHGGDASTLLSNADRAMYRAKRGNLAYAIFDEASTKQGSQCVSMSQHLYKGICNNEVSVVFQPKVAVGGGTVVGAEVLARWHSATLGEVGPGEFVPVAERSSLIETLTYSVAEQALAHLKEWRDWGFEMPIALNLSARMLDEKKFRHWLCDEATKRNIDHSLITLEITETALSSSGERAHGQLNELIDAGFELSIDDFGHGFTSFRHVRDIAFTELKIDRLYIRNIVDSDRDAAIVMSMLQLARSLQMTAVAEGVETQDQLDCLRSLGCGYAQGYHFARPMPSGAFVDWVKGATMGAGA